VFRVEGLVKRYGDLRAVDGISFEVRKGELYGLLGPNGAGKTTTMSMLSGLLAPDEGRVFFDGIELGSDPIRIKAQLGIVPQETALYETLSARENLRFWAGLYGLAGAGLDQAVARVLELVGLTGRAKDPVKTFSGGMKRRLNLALGLVHGPRAVLMDEPTVGIDPQARANILEAVRAVTAAGTTVIYTTHYLEEAETLCDRVAIIDHGRILAEGTVDELKRRVSEKEILTVSGSFEVEEARARLEGNYRPGELNEARLRMANTPEGASLVDNPVSTAPGFQMGNVFVMAGIPVIMQAMFEGAVHRLVGGQPLLSRTLTVTLPEGKIAAGFGALQERYPDVEMGSYPFSRDGRFATRLVLRSSDEDRLAAAAAELDAMIASLGGEGTWDRTG